MLIKYIGSKHVADKIGNNNADGILNFLRGHVFTHEERFAAYRYNDTRSFRDYSNTPLEGTNGGLKYCNFAVKPNMKLSKSASYMICQDENKYVDKIRMSYSNFSKTKLYGLEGESRKAARRIVPAALGEMVQQIGLASTYCSMRISYEKWVVRVAKENHKAIGTQLIPRFLRYRCVQRDDIGGFCCTCPYAKIYGIPCRHIIHVIQSYCSSPYFFTHHDVDVRWWTTYSILVSLMDPVDLVETERLMKTELIRIRLNEDLCIGQHASLEPFHGEVYVCGSQSSDGLQRISLGEAKARLFDNVDVSYPINYDISSVGSALASLNGGYDGVRRMYNPSYGGESQWENDDAFDDGFEVDDSSDDFTSRMAAEDDFTTRLAERTKTKVDRYQVMVALNKSLWDMFENCTEEFFEEMKQECEIANRAMAIRVQQHLVQNSGKVNDVIKSGAVLCKPTNVLNVGKEHRKQNKY